MCAALLRTLAAIRAHGVTEFNSRLAPLTESIEASRPGICGVKQVGALPPVSALQSLRDVAFQRK